MAFQLKHWIGIVWLSCALIALWRLPLDSAAGRPTLIRSAPEIRHAALVEELRDARMQLDQIRRAEALPTMAGGEPQQD